MAKLSFACLALLTFNLVSSSAVPALPRAADSTGVVKPGPGMPSLESLGLTSEALRAMGPVEGLSFQLLSSCSQCKS